MCAAIPILERYEVTVSHDERAHLKLLAENRLAAEPSLHLSEYFGTRVRCGFVSGPALLIDDRSEIALASTPEETLLEYRPYLLAEHDDMLVISGDRRPEYERYLNDLTGVSGVDVVITGKHTGDQTVPLPRRCTENPDILNRIARVARQARRLSIVPVSATGNVWLLALAIASAANVPVFVAGPPPRLSQQVNNKLWFAERVGELFGKRAHPPFYAAYGAAALAARVRAVSQNSERLVIKIPNSAGSAGNLVLNADDIRDRPLSKLRLRLIDLLATLGVSASFPLQVEVWESPVLSSPSVQIWIPHKKAGAPIVEGVFEQTLEGSRGEFIGATLAHLPLQWREQLCREAMHLAILFQELGYFGRCSFDALISGEDYLTGSLYWIECNGRWGGTSLPMTFLNRLAISSPTYQFVIVQRTGLILPERSFHAVVGLLEDILFDKRGKSEGVILLTPAGLERGTGAHFVTIAKTLSRAEELARDTLLRLVGTT